MKAVQAEAELAAVEPVRLYDLRQAGIGGGKGDIVVMGVRFLEVIGTAEVVLGAGAAYGGKFAVAIQIELDFPLSLPATAVDPRNCAWK